MIRAGEACNRVAALSVLLHTTPKLISTPFLVCKTEGQWVGLKIGFKLACKKLPNLTKNELLSLTFNTKIV